MLVCCASNDDGANIMAEYQWLVMAAVAIAAVIVTIYFGVQNLRNVAVQRDRESGHASGRVEAKLENLEQIVRAVSEDLRTVKEDLRAVNGKLDAHDVLLRQMRGEAKKQGRRLRKLDKRVEALESNLPVPPTNPPASSARVYEMPERDSDARRGGGQM